MGMLEGCSASGGIAYLLSWIDFPKWHTLYHVIKAMLLLMLPAIGTWDGILLAWDASIVAVSNPHYTNNMLTTLV